MAALRLFSRCCATARWGASDDSPVLAGQVDVKSTGKYNLVLLKVIGLTSDLPPLWKIFLFVAFCNLRCTFFGTQTTMDFCKTPCPPQPWDSGLMFLVQTPGAKPNRKRPTLPAWCQFGLCIATAGRGRNGHGAATLSLATWLKGMGLAQKDGETTRGNQSFFSSLPLVFLDTLFFCL